MCSTLAALVSLLSGDNRSCCATDCLATAAATAAVAAAVDCDCCVIDQQAMRMAWK